HSPSLQGRSGRGRRLSCIDHHQQLGAHHQKQRPPRRPRPAYSSGDSQVKGSAPSRLVCMVILVLWTLALALAVNQNLGAFQAEARPAGGGIQQGNAQSAQDLWNFADDAEAVTSWTADLNDQAH